MSASTTCATPSSALEGAILSARAFTSVDEAGIRAIRGKRFCIYAGFQQPGARSEELTGASCAAVEIEV